jgi:hypothetical protein
MGGNFLKIDFLNCNKPNINYLKNNADFCRTVVKININVNKFWQKMKKVIILGGLLTLCIITLYAQKQNCNRTIYMESFKEHLPQNICFPNGYILLDILSDTVDINGDSRVDFVGKLEKINAQDGDTTLVILYKQNTNGFFEEWITFNNLFPIYLRDYSYNYERDYVKHKDTSLFMKLRLRYSSPEYSDVFFNRDTIVVKFNQSARSGLLLYFKFDRIKNDWYLIKQMEWIGSRGEIEKMPEYGIIIPQNQYSIREFNMLDYLDDVLW